LCPVEIGDVTEKILGRGDRDDSAITGLENLWVATTRIAVELCRNANKANSKLATSDELSVPLGSGWPALLRHSPQMYFAWRRF